MADIGKLMLDQFKPPEVAIDCVRCRRHATVTVAALKKKFGNQRLDVIARMVARSSTGGAYSVTCALAEDPFQQLCSARPIEVDPVLWANLLDAERGGWRAILHCCRHHENLKRAKSCPESVSLPVMVLKAIFGWDFELEKLPRRLRCPNCGSHSIEIEWIIPAEAPDPAGASEAAPVLQLRPSRAALGRRRFRVIDKTPKRAAGGGDDG
jgi:hypothetical protein